MAYNKKKKQRKLFSQCMLRQTTSFVPLALDALFLAEFFTVSTLMCAFLTTVLVGVIVVVHMIFCLPSVAYKMNTTVVQTDSAKRLCMISFY